MNRVSLELDIRILCQSLHLDLLKDLLLKAKSSELIGVEDLCKLVFHLYKDQLVLSHHVNSLCLKHCLFLFFPHASFLSHLPVQFLIQLSVLLSELVVLLLLVLYVSLKLLQIHAQILPQFKGSDLNLSQGSQRSVVKARPYSLSSFKVRLHILTINLLVDIVHLYSASETHCKLIIISN